MRARCGSGDGQVEVGREVVYVRACGRSRSGERKGEELEVRTGGNEK